MRPRAHCQGTFVPVPRPRLQVDVALGFDVEFGIPHDPARAVHGNPRLGEQTRSRVQGAENEIDRATQRWNIDDEIRPRSQSRGTFVLFSLYIIDYYL